MNIHIASNTTTSNAQLLQIVRPAWLLRAEGAVLLAAAVWLYAIYSGNWLLFALLLLAPDLSALGYLRDSHLGATTYNIAHTLILPALLIAVGFILGNMGAVGLALIWFAHIGMDRMLGYGLKYATEFKDTHLGKV
ncbi:MAG: DUF4260 domain-containing protein [Ktedonobacteraceae bacterium]|nr:DUF4260 domain-containing protein [Ktedonobacteraceae bacterium]